MRLKDKFVIDRQGCKTKKTAYSFIQTNKEALCPQRHKKLDLDQNPRLIFFDFLFFPVVEIKGGEKERR
jgi:hypothetical protein